MDGIEGTTIYRVGNPTLGAVGFGLLQADPQSDPQPKALRQVPVPPARVVSQPVDPFPPTRWYDRLWTALTRPRTLWAWLTPWR